MLAKIPAGILLELWLGRSRKIREGEIANIFCVFGQRKNFLFFYEFGKKKFFFFYQVVKLGWFFTKKNPVPSNPENRGVIPKVESVQIFFSAKWEKIPSTGFEPATPRIRVRCSNHWATKASTARTGSPLCSTLVTQTLVFYEFGDFFFCFLRIFSIFSNFLENSRNFLTNNARFARDVARRAENFFTTSFFIINFWKNRFDELFLARWKNLSF